MDVGKAGKRALVQGGLVLMIGAGLAALFLLKIVWSWTFPDLFPRAVEQGLVAAEVSWYASFKLALFLGIMSVFMRSGGS